jgi:hypothetical protein
VTDSGTPERGDSKYMIAMQSVQETRLRLGSQLLSTPREYSRQLLGISVNTCDWRWQDETWAVLTFVHKVFFEMGVSCFDHLGESSKTGFSGSL